MSDFIKRFGSTLAALATSKKAIAAVTGVILVACARIGLVLPESSTMEIVGIVMTYLLSQGLADLGKESLKVVVPLVIATVSFAMVA